MSAPAARASFCLSPFVNTATRWWPGAVGQHDRAADHLIGVTGIDAQASPRDSTVSSNLRGAAMAS
jgi:hypothetical protein